MVNYKKHVALISLGVLALLLSSTAIFIQYNKSQGNNGPNSFSDKHSGNRPNGDQIITRQQGKGCCGGVNNNVTANSSINYHPVSSGINFNDESSPKGNENNDNEDKKADCGCHCPKGGQK